MQRARCAKCSWAWSCGGVAPSGVFSHFRALTVHNVWPKMAKHGHMWLTRPCSRRPHSLCFCVCVWGVPPLWDVDSWVSSMTGPRVPSSERRPERRRSWLGI